MLRFLKIDHLAVIDAVAVEFEPGLNVLTGETGAGKSILVEAVGLLLGGRASGELVRTGEDLAAIEAIFENGGEELLVRREITAQGRSRAFVNGALVTAGALKDLASRLVELHGQHEHQTLLDPATHLPVLDAFGGLEDLVARIGEAFAVLRDAHDEIERVRKAAADREARFDIVTFQLNELERAALKNPIPGEPDEDAQLATARQVLASAEHIERLCAESYTALYDSDDAVLSQLGAVWKRVGELASIDPRFQPYVDARDGIKAQLDDLATFLRRYTDSIEASPARLQEVEERLALLEKLKRKFGPTYQDLIARRAALKRELEDLEGGDERVAALERQQAKAREAYVALAQQLSAERQRVATHFARRLEQLLGDLAMGSTRFEVRFNAAPLPPSAWTATGIDQAEFFVSPNPGEDLRPLARIVSGGELSRIMLAIKTIVARSRSGFTEADDRVAAAAPPGLIFDEVDAGIGGRVADVVGRTLRTLGSAFQVLCITHLPQIAAYADTHFQIDKRVADGRTRTTVRRLDADGRVEELARMLGGEAITDGLRASAREMLVGRSQSPGLAPTAIAARDRGAKGERAKGESPKSDNRARGEKAPRPRR